jgi:hypothetical protein
MLSPVAPPARREDVFNQVRPPARERRAMVDLDQDLASAVRAGAPVIGE